MAYVPLVSPLAPACEALVVPKESETPFTSKIAMETATPGMTVPAVLPGSKPPPGLKVLKNPNAKQQPNAFQQEQNP